QQIAKRLKTFPDLDQTMNVSHTTIYSTIRALPKGELKKDLLSCLRHENKKRKANGEPKKILYYRILKLFMSAQPKFKKEKSRVIGKLI
ncbi:transposase domain protein, partial [Acinetobacter sp. 478810]